MEGREKPELVIHPSYTLVQGQIQHTYVNYSINKIEDPLLKNQILQIYSSFFIQSFPL